jgi:pimeloyl-ACP methyl ester carboxylesterase
MELPRRAFLGLAIKDAKDGVAVTRVVAGSMGAAAALEPGDVIEALDGEAVSSVGATMRVLRGAAGKESVRLLFRRAGEAREIAVPVVPMPRERVDGCEVRYGHVVSRGARLRTITIDAGGPAMLFLQGIRCQSIDLAMQPDVPIARLMHGLARAGITTVRVERPGLGDSEGGPCDAIDWDDEVDVYAAALRERGDMFLFGHSVGGVVAPILAERFPVRGIVAYGTSAERWSAALRQGFERQWRLRGHSDVQLAERLARFDASPFDDRHERSIAFHHGIEGNDAAAAWSRVKVPVSILIGEHDWVVGEGAQRAITELAPHAEVTVLDGLDHAFTRHDGLAASLRDYGTGDFDDRIVDVTARFVFGD